MVTLNTSEADILTRAIDPHSPSLPPEVARVLSKLDFAAEDHAVMHDLTAKAKAGELTTDDESLLRRYEIVNDLLTLLRVKATVSLSESTRRERN